MASPGHPGADDADGADADAAPEEAEEAPVEADATAPGAEVVGDIGEMRLGFTGFHYSNHSTLRK